MKEIQLFSLRTKCTNEYLDTLKVLDVACVM
jgi:hypothetical protein